MASRIKNHGFVRASRIEALPILFWPNLGDFLKYPEKGVDKHRSECYHNT